jgi:hypothetical protein
VSDHDAIVIGMGVGGAASGDLAMVVHAPEERMTRSVGESDRTTRQAVETQATTTTLPALPGASPIP